MIIQIDKLPVLSIHLKNQICNKNLPPRKIYLCRHLKKLRTVHIRTIPLEKLVILFNKTKIWEMKTWKIWNSNQENIFSLCQLHHFQHLTICHLKLILSRIKFCKIWDHRRQEKWIKSENLLIHQMILRLIQI